jgi:type IV secretion system protein VirD4
LLTPGEVMQLPPTDELVLVSGLLPIRAKKLRYYEDPNFTGRIRPAPELATGDYADKPVARPNDWSGQVRGIDGRLMQSDERGNNNIAAVDEGGPQQQRHPGLSDEMASSSSVPVQGELFPTLDDGADSAADKTVMDRLSTAARVYGVDDGIANDRDDIVPGF